MRLLRDDRDKFYLYTKVDGGYIKWYGGLGTKGQAFKITDTSETAKAFRFMGNVEPVLKYLKENTDYDWQITPQRGCRLSVNSSSPSITLLSKNNCRLHQRGSLRLVESNSLTQSRISSVAEIVTVGCIQRKKEASKKRCADHASLSVEKSVVEVDDYTTETFIYL